MIDAGLASVVAIVYGTNQRSAGNTFGHALGRVDEASVYGFLNVAGPAAMAFRRHQSQHGTTEADLAEISVSQRKYAVDNPLAIFREPMTVEDYLAAPYLVEPLRRPDLCMISDGAACLIVARADRAAELTDRPVHVMGIAQQTGLRDRQNADQWLRPWIQQVADRVYPAAGIERDGIDALYVQDPTSIWVLQMLEHYGFVEPGGVGEAFRSGAVGHGGRLPLNTNGGQLSEAYMWGFLHLCEAVRQLRGDAGRPAARGAAHRAVLLDVRLHEGGQHHPVDGARVMTYETVATQDDSHFWAEAAQGRLVFQRCDQCRFLRWPAAGRLPRVPGPRVRVGAGRAHAAPCGATWSTTARTPRTSRSGSPTTSRWSSSTAASGC